MHRLYCIVLGGLAAFTAVAVGQMPKKNSLADQLDTWIEEHRRANNPYVDALRTAKTAEEKEVIRKAQAKLAKEYSDRIYTIADKTPKTQTGLTALEWILKYDLAGPNFSKAMDVLIKYYLHSPALTPVLTSLRPEAGGADKLLKSASEKSQWAENRAAALLTWSRNLQSRADLTEKKDEAARLLKDAEQKANDLVSKYPLVGRGSYAKEARDILYELQNLSVGKIGPDISAEDLDGQPFKLKDYRGKIVVLAFWHSKHPKTGQIFSESQQLLASHSGKPLVIIGVNNEKPEFAKEFLDASKITWRCWHDRGRKIANDWRSDGSTIYVLDGKGVIRGRNLREQQLTELVDSLLKE